MGHPSSTQPVGAISSRWKRVKMRNRGLLFTVIAALAATALFGCGPQVAPVSPEQQLAMIPTGEPLLACRADCLAAWRAAEPQAETLAAGRRWVDLGLLVLRVNYEDDLTVYYLAEAAQGMGYRTAAASYYRQSIELSGGPAACAVYSRLCGGVSLPRAASARLAALVRLVPRRQPIRAEKALPKAEEPPAAPAAPTLEGLPAAPASPVRAPSQEEEQFIEPPPPARP
jgi:hypothetical protein